MPIPEEFIVQMIAGDIANASGVSTEEVLDDFNNFSKAIDAKMSEGYSEDEAIVIVSENWVIPYATKER